ncbi:MAG: hypothetical protein ACYTG6_16145 [Planctomycetota bacterium]|jgi:hypothetical protein
MFNSHPWSGEPFGPIEYEWYLRRGFVFNVEFDVDQGPFIDFCRQRGRVPNEVLMGLAARLSTTHLPQRAVALNRRTYPVRYPAGYVRPVREGRDMLEHVAVRERPDRVEETNIRQRLHAPERWFITHLPRLSIFLATHLFARREVMNGYALMLTRNPLRRLGGRVVFHGTQYRTAVLTIPFGRAVTCVFGAPHALGNINAYEEFLLEFRTWMEQPDQIPPELVDKPYRTASRGA